MQKEFNRHYPSLNVRIIGINEIRHESANDQITNGRNLPWLQDIDSNGNGVSDVWYDLWQITYRDVVVVNPASQETGRFNVTTQSLGVPENYDQLKVMFIDAATTPAATPWQSPIEPLDVNNNGNLAANDALLVINALALKTYANGVLPNLGGATPPAYYDVNGDSNITPQDAVIVINHLTLTAQPSAALSESAGHDVTDATAESGESVSEAADLAITDALVRFPDLANVNLVYGRTPAPTFGLLLGPQTVGIKPLDFGLSAFSDYAVAASGIEMNSPTSPSIPVALPATMETSIGQGRDTQPGDTVSRGDSLDEHSERVDQVFASGW